MIHVNLNTCWAKVNDYEIINVASLGGSTGTLALSKQGDKRHTGQDT